MVFGLILCGHRDNTYPVPGMEALIACLIFRILSVKNETNSLQALVDRCSEATDTGGFISLWAVANKARALLLFLVMMSEKDCLAFLSSRFLMQGFSF